MQFAYPSPGSAFFLKLLAILTAATLPDRTAFVSELVTSEQIASIINA
jgi:hypothetical protein